MKRNTINMLSVKETIVLEWKSVSLPIHREEELDFALHHVSYDSPFSSSYEERKAYYGEDWHKFTGEALEILCTLPNAFTPEQKTSLLREYRSMIHYGNTTLDMLESFQIPLGAIVCHFLNTSLEEAESYLKLYGYRPELLKMNQCTEEQKKLIQYCYRVRSKEQQTKANSSFLQKLEDKYGSDILSLAIQQYKVEECLHQLKQQIDKTSSLKDRL